MPYLQPLLPYIHCLDTGGRKSLNFEEIIPKQNENTDRIPKVAGYALAGLSRKSPWAFVALLLLSITSFAQMEGNH